MGPRLEHTGVFVFTCSEERLGGFAEVDVVEAASLESLVRESQLIVTTTPSREPLVAAEWLHPGLHITAMGSDLAGKQELDPEVLKRAHRVVCDRRAQCLSMGELQHVAGAWGAGDEAEVVELGDIASGRSPGRRSEDEITVCDLTGTGVQDTAIALLAYERAIEKGLGTKIEV